MEGTAGSQPCKWKRLTEVLKPPTPSPAKTDSCNLFHNRTQDRTNERENYTVLDLGISKDREWAAKAPRVGLLNTYCAGKRPRTWWSTRLPILKKTLRDATLPNKYVWECNMTLSKAISTPFKQHEQCCKPVHHSLQRAKFGLSE